MKKLRAAINQWFDRLDERWRLLPINKQHQYTMCFFAAYLTLTAWVLLKVWYDAGKGDKNMVIARIENPILKKKESPAVLQDTVSTIFKNRIYERK
jgi:hypothetical protein